MRILHVGKYYPPERGGIEQYTAALARFGAAGGDDVAVLAHQRPGNRRTTTEAIDGVAVTRAGCLGALAYAPLAPAFPLVARRVIATFRPDLIHIHVPNPSAFALLVLLGARRVPWIVQWQADIDADAVGAGMRALYRVYRPFETVLLRRSRAIIASSGAYANASRTLARWREKVAIVPLGIGPATAPVPGASANWPRRPGLKLLAVGRLAHYKGFEVLLDALTQYADANLLLVGTGERETALRAQIHTLGLGGRVVMAGDLSDASLAAAYASADAFVLPSLNRSESFGLVLLEAMRAGRPVIASDIPGSGVGSIVVDGVTGMLVPPGDAPALAGAMAALADPALRTALGHAGHARWLERFTLERSAQEVREIQERVAMSGARQEPGLRDV